MLDNKPFIIASHQRCGSHLLMDLLYSTGKVGDCFESWLVGMMENEEDDDDLLSVFNDIRERTKVRPSESGQWGTKINVQEYYLLQRYVDLVGNVKCIHLRRKNKLDRGLSHLRARSTGVYYFPKDDDFWMEKSESYGEIDFSYDNLCEVVLQGYVGDDIWEEFFRKNGIEHLEIFYEDFSCSLEWDNVVAMIFDFLGVSYTLPLNVSTRWVKMSKGDKPDSYKALVENIMTSEMWRYLYDN